MARYVESAVLRLEDQASADIAKVRKNLLRFAATARSVQAQLARGGGIGVLGGGSTSGGRSSNAALLAQTRAATKNQAAINSLSSAYASAQGNASQFARTMAKVTAQMNQQSRISKEMQREAGRQSSRSNALRPGWAASGYLPKDVAGSRRAAKGGKGGRRVYGELGLGFAGGAKAMAGAETLGMLIHAVRKVVHTGGEAVADYSNQISSLRVEGLDEAGIKKIENAALEISKAHPQISQGESIAKIREQFSQSGSWDDAIDMVKGFSAPNAAGSAARDVVLAAQNLPNVKNAGIDLGKAAENLLGDYYLKPAGKIFAQQMQNKWAQTIIEQRGNLTPDMIKQMVLKSMGSLRGKYDWETKEGQQKALDEIGVYAAVLAGEQGGQVTGTMMNSASRAFSGRMTDESKAAFEKRGLLDPTKILKRNKQGDPHKLAYGAFKGYQGKSLFGYVMDVLAPALEASGDLQDPERREAAVNEMFSNQKTAGSIKAILSQHHMLHKSKENVDKMQPMGTAESTYNEGDIGSNIRAMQGAAQSLMQKSLKPFITHINSTMQYATNQMNGPDGGGPLGALGVGALGLTASAGAIALGQLQKNPAVAANTIATTGLTAAVIANTAAQVAVMGVKAATTFGQMMGSMFGGGKAPGAFPPITPEETKNGRASKLGPYAANAGRYLKQGLKIGGVPAALSYLAGATTNEEDKVLAEVDQKSKELRRIYGDDVFSKARADYQPLWRRRSIDSADERDSDYINKWLAAHPFKGDMLQRMGYFPSKSETPWGSTGLLTGGKSPLPWGPGQFGGQSVTQLIEEIEKFNASIHESVSSSGDEAASKLQQQAGTIGGAIGEAAAAKIQAATANVTINVNQQSAPANTGGNGLQGKK